MGHTGTMYSWSAVPQLMRGRWGTAALCPSHPAAWNTLAYPSLTPPVLARLVPAALRDYARAAHRLPSLSCLFRRNSGDTQAQVAAAGPWDEPGAIRRRAAPVAAAPVAAAKHADRACRRAHRIVQR